MAVRSGRWQSVRRRSSAQDLDLERLEDRLALSFSDLSSRPVVDLAVTGVAATNTTGAIFEPYDRQFYRISIPGSPPDPSQPESAKLLTIAQRADSSTLDSLLSVYNAAGELLTSNDDSPAVFGTGTDDSQVELIVVPGRTYYVEAAGFYVSTGSFRLSLKLSDVDSPPAVVGSAPDDFGASFDDAAMISLAGDGRASRIGNIEAAGDVDRFQFVALATGQLKIQAHRHPAGRLVSRLTVYDSNRQVVAVTSGDDSGAGLAVHVEAGERYFVDVSGSGSSVGRYVLSLVGGSVFDDVAAPAEFHLPATGLAQLAGSIDYASDQDEYFFIAPTSGFLTIQSDREPGGGVMLRTELRDSSGAVLASAIGPSPMSAMVAAGARYSFVVASQAGSTGDWLAEFRLDSPADDDYNFDFLDPQTIAFSDGATTSISGVINSIDDYDVFSVVAPAAGSLLGTLPFNDDASQTFMQVFAVDADGQFIPLDVLSPGRQSFSFDAPNAGARFVFFVASFGGVGRYTVHLRAAAAPKEDDHGDSVVEATGLSLDESGRGRAAGTMGSATDVDAFSFRAPQGASSAELVVTAAAGAPPGFDPKVEIVDDLGRLVFESDNHDGSPDPLAVFNVEGGRTYTIFVSKAGSSPLGDYDVQLAVRKGGLVVYELGSQTQGRTVTPEALVRTLLGGSLDSSGVQVLSDSIVYEGAPRAAGIYTGGDGVLNTRDVGVGMDQGVILTTGGARNAVGPNYSGGATDDNQSEVGGRFADLFEKLAPGLSVRDASVLAFDFVPQANVVQFRFVFASEEYNEFVNKGFSDVFGLFVNGRNVARAPGTDNYIAGSGEVVSVDTVNALRNSAFFIDNADRAASPFGSINIEYDGLTTILTASAPVVAGERNSLAIAIADVRDSRLDSAVFLKGASLVSTPEQVKTAEGNGLAATFSSIVADATAASSSLPESEIHREIHEQFLRDLLKGLGVELVGDFLVIPVDPVDFTLTTPDGKVVGNGVQPRLDVPNAFYARSGTDELLILPNATPGTYTIELAGASSAVFRLGVSYVEAGGRISTNLFQGSLPQSQTLTSVLDFRVLVRSTDVAEVAPPPGEPAPSQSPSVAGGVGPSGRLFLVSIPAAANVSASAPAGGSNASVNLTAESQADDQAAALGRLLAREREAAGGLTAMAAAQREAVRLAIQTASSVLSAFGRNIATTIDSLFVRLASGERSFWKSEWFRAVGTATTIFSPLLHLPMSLLGFLAHQASPGGLDAATMAPESGEGRPFRPHEPPNAAPAVDGASDVDEAFSDDAWSAAATVGLPLCWISVQDRGRKSRRLGT